MRHHERVGRNRIVTTTTTGSDFVVRQKTTTRLCCCVCCTWNNEMQMIARVISIQYYFSLLFLLLPVGLLFELDLESICLVVVIFCQGSEWGLFHSLLLRHTRKCVMDRLWLTRQLGTVLTLSTAAAAAATQLRVAMCLSFFEDIQRPDAKV
jgi:hypothetical protein